MTTLAHLISLENTLIIFAIGLIAVIFVGNAYMNDFVKRNERWREAQEK